MTGYGKTSKDRPVARLSRPENASAEAVPRKIDIGVSSLERWRAEALAMPERWRGVAPCALPKRNTRFAPSFAALSEVVSKLGGDQRAFSS